MYLLEGKTLRYAIDRSAHCVSVYNTLTHHEYMALPGHIWKMIYAIPGYIRQVKLLCGFFFFTAFCGFYDIFDFVHNIGSFIKKRQNA